MRRNGIPIGDGQNKLRNTLTVEICQLCNSWLNFNVEFPARELIKQLLIAAETLEELTPGEQRDVARWIGKTELFRSLALGHSNASWRQLRYLRAHGDLPPRMSIWIAQAADNVPTGPPVQNLRPKPELIDSLVIPWGCWGISGRYWRLRYIVIDEPADPNRTIELPVELQPMFAWIWPPNEAVIGWPPEVILDRPTDEALTSVLGFDRTWFPLDESSE
jgi:hypothetical protein